MEKLLVWDHIPNGASLGHDDQGADVHWFMTMVSGCLWMFMVLNLNIVRLCWFSTMIHDDS